MGRRKRQARETAATASTPSPATTRPPRTRWAAIAGVVLGAAGLVAAGFLLTRRGPPLDVLLVTIDTLRPDRLGCYGHRDAATPVLDGLAARGARFATSIAHTPLTGPSHSSILTGLLPPAHGVRDNGSYALPPGIPTLAEAFKRGGYGTAAFVSGFPLDRRFGLARGFDEYDDRLPRGHDPRRAPYVERPADATTRVALEWLRSATPPWFLWVHYFDPHAPYEPPGDLAANFEGRPYDGEVAFVDRELGRLLRGAGAEDAEARMLVLVTADHGESLGEHAEDTHGVFLYDATLRVPWIVAGPGVPSGRVSPVVARGIDVVPTLLDYAGLPALAGAQGRSLRAAADGRSMPDAPVYAESLFARLNLGWAELHALRTETWKLVDAPRPELFALDRDVGETRDVAAAHPEQVEALRRHLRPLLATKPPDARLAQTGDGAERLRALGYVGGTAPAAPTLRDPKDAIGLLRRLERGLAEARANPTLAAAELTAVIREEPRMPLARRYRAIAYQVADQPDAALADLHVLEREGPLSSEDLVLLAETLRLAGRAAEGLPALDRAARLEPRSPEPSIIRGRLLRAMGRKDEAAGTYRRVLEVAPHNAEALRGLGDLALEVGDLQGAARLYERILSTDPQDAEALVRLGVSRVRTGRVAEAVPLFESAVRLAPGSAEAHLSLAGALAKSGRPAEAVPHFERAIAIGGRTTVALNGLGFARLEAGDAAAALEALRASLALEPHQPPVADVVSRLGRGQKP